MIDRRLGKDPPPPADKPEPKVETKGVDDKTGEGSAPDTNASAGGSKEPDGDGTKADVKPNAEIPRAPVRYGAPPLPKGPSRKRPE